RSVSSGQFPTTRAGSTGRCNTTWYKSSSKGGVHVARETMEAFCRPAGRYVEPLESGAVLPAIGRALGKDHVVIQLLLARHGGIACSPWPNAKTSPAESPAAARCGSSPNV